MNQNFVLLFAVIVFVAGGVGIYTLGKPSHSEMDTAQQMQENTLSDADEPSAMKPSDNHTAQMYGTYAEFSPEAFTKAVTTRRVLFFYSNWCPTCLAADQSFAENSSKFPTDLSLLRVNYSDSETDQAEKELAKKYNITYQHTYVQIDAQGNEVTKWNGGQFDELLNNLK